MAMYPIDEFLELITELKKLDCEIMHDCLYGLTVYAAQHARDNPESPKIGELRELIENLARFWKLNDGNVSILEYDYLQPFDEMLETVKSGADIDRDALAKLYSAAVYGLYRHCGELTIKQGNEARDEILAISALAHEIISVMANDLYPLDYIACRSDDESNDLCEYCQESPDSAQT